MDVRSITYMLLHIYEVTSLQPGVLVTTRPSLIATTISGAARHLYQILHNRHFPPTFPEEKKVRPTLLCAERSGDLCAD